MIRKWYGWEYVISTVVLAAILWAMAFLATWGNFWLKISFASAAMALLSLWVQGGRPGRIEIKAGDLAVGVGSAVALYMIFWAGQSVSTALLPFATEDMNEIYGRSGPAPSWLLALISLLLTGLGEELYWRGYLQGQLMSRLGPRPGWLAATALYGAVHMCTGNPVIVGGAVLAGLFWGYLYLRLGRLAPVVISHALWSILIFAVRPLW